MCAAPRSGGGCCPCFEYEQKEERVMLFVTAIPWGADGSGEMWWNVVKWMGLIMLSHICFLQRPGCLDALSLSPHENLIRREKKKKSLAWAMNKVIFIRDSGLRHSLAKKEFSIWPHESIPHYEANTRWHLLMVTGLHLDNILCQKSILRGGKMVSGWHEIRCLWMSNWIIKSTLQT